MVEDTGEQVGDGAVTRPGQGEEAIVAATTIINAYSVVWLPVSGSKWRDVVGVATDRVFVGMRAPS